jgi:glycosyltransferase involved in cell wall biosynthesis
LAKRFFRRLARSRIGRFSSVIVTNPSERRYVKEELGVPESKVTMVPNGISTKQFEVLAGVGKKDRKKEEPVVVSYVGNIGLPQNLIVLLQVAKEMPDLIFNIIGAGEDIERIRAYKNKNQISNAHLLGRVQWEEVPEIYSSTDILYAQLSPGFSGALPSKLYEYLSTGKFFVYGGEGQAPEFLKEFDNHLVVPPDNPDALKHAIEETIRSERHELHSEGNVEGIRKNYLRETNAGKWFDQLETESGTG